MIYAYLLFSSAIYLETKYPKKIEQSLKEKEKCEPYYVNHLQPILLRLGTSSCMTYYMP